MNNQQLLARFTIPELKAAADLKKYTVNLKKKFKRAEKKNSTKLREIATLEIEEEIKRRKSEPDYNPFFDDVSTTEIISELEERLLKPDSVTGRLNLKAIHSFIQGSYYEGKISPKLEHHHPRSEYRAKSKSLVSSNAVEDDLQKVIDEQRKDARLANNPFLAYFIARDVQGSNIWNKFGLRGLLREVKERTGLAPVSWKGGAMSYDGFFTLQEILTKDIKSGEFKYFVPQGVYLMAQDLQKRGTKLNVSVTSFNLNSRKKLAALLEEDESKIKRDWKPHRFDMTLDAIETSLDFMRRKYQENPDAFFERYGSPQGTNNLVEDMKPEREFKTNLRKVHTLLGDGESLSKMLDIEDERFKTKWNPSVIQISPSELEVVRDILHRSLNEDKNKFYAVYGSAFGTVILSKELATKGLDISPARLSSVLVNTDKASSILGIRDDEFEKRWNVKEFSDEYPIFDTTMKRLKEAYNKDPDTFFSRYGCDIGAFNVAQDLKGQGGEKSIKMQVVSRIIREGQLISRILDINDDRFKTHWHPSQIVPDYDDAEKVLEFMRAKHKKNPDAFFGRYGSKLGLYYLMKDLSDVPELRTKPDQNLKGIAYSGERLSRLLGIKDTRFSSAWHPRSLTLNSQQVDQVGEFLKDKYDSNPKSFFKRYGAEDGLLQLSRDLEEEQGVRLSSSRLGNILMDVEATQQLIGINDPNFDSKWNIRSIQVKNGIPDQVGEFLRTQYDQDPTRFFVRYGGKTGQVLMLEDLRKTGIKIPLMQLGSLIGKSSLVSRLTGIPESEFEGRWRSRHVGMKRTHISRITDILTNAYHEDPELFFERYGGKEGIVNLAERLKEDDVHPNLHFISNLIGDPETVQELMKVEDDRFLGEWAPRKVSISSRQLRPTIDFLRRSYFADSKRFFDRYGSRAGIYNLAIDLNEGGMLASGDMERIYDLVARPSIQEVLGIRDPKFGEKWNPANIPLNLNEFRAISTHLKEQFDKNPDTFFDYYRKPLRSIILGKEAEALGINENPPVFSVILNDGKFVGELVGSADKRFADTWPRKAYVMLQGAYPTMKNMEQSIGQGLERMAESCSLPSMGSPLGKDEREYLALRYGLRMVNENTAHHVVELYAGAKQKAIKKNIKEILTQDAKDMRELSSIKNFKEVSEFGDEAFTNLAGHLLYSFDPSIRAAAGHKILELYTPTFQRIIANRNIPDISKGYDTFSKYCENFDMYAIKFGGLKERKQVCPVPLPGRVYSIIQSIGSGRYYDWSDNVMRSLDVNDDKEGGYLHEIIS